MARRKATRREGAKREAEAAGETVPPLGRYVRWRLTTPARVNDGWVATFRVRVPVAAENTKPKVAMGALTPPQAAPLEGGNRLDLGDLTDVTSANKVDARPASPAAPVPRRRKRTSQKRRKAA